MKLTDSQRSGVARRGGQWVRWSLRSPTNSRRRRRCLQYAAVLFDFAGLSEQAAMCRREAQVVTPSGDPVPLSIVSCERPMTDAYTILHTNPITEIDRHGRLLSGPGVPIGGGHGTNKRIDTRFVGVAGVLADPARVVEFVSTHTPPMTATTKARIDTITKAIARAKSVSRIIDA